MTLNVGTVNMILLMLITVVKVFLTNLVTKPMLEMSCARLRSPTPIMALDYTACKGGGGGSLGKD